MTDEERKANAARAKRRWRAANPDKVRAQKRRDYERHREARLAASSRAQKANRKAARERTRRFHEAHPEKEREYRQRYKARHAQAVARRHRRYREANRALVKEGARRYKQANADKVLDATHAYQARKRGAFVEHVDRRVVFSRDGGVCGLCGGPVDPQAWHLDHITPLSRGGAHSYANTQVTHPKCNQIKGARIAA